MIKIFFVDTSLCWFLRIKQHQQQQKQQRRKLTYHCWAAPPFFEEEEEPEADEDESEPVSLEPEVSVAEPDFLDEEEEVVCLSSHWNLSPLISPLVFNLLKALQDNSTVSLQDETTGNSLGFKSTIVKSTVNVDGTTNGFQFRKPENDLNSLLSEICKAPPMDFKLGKSNSVKSSFC